MGGDGWPTPHPGRFTPGKTLYPLYRRLGGPQSRSEQVWKISPTPGFNPQTVQPVTSRYTDWAIPVPVLREFVKIVVACYITYFSLYSTQRGFFIWSYCAVWQNSGRTTNGGLFVGLKGGARTGTWLENIQQVLPLIGEGESRYCRCSENVSVK